MSSNIDDIMRQLDSTNPVDAKPQTETNPSGQANTGPSRLIVLMLVMAVIGAAAGAAMFFFIR